MDRASRVRVVVVGITGRLGKRIARELMSRGHEVLGVNRRPEQVPVVLGELVSDPRLRTRAGDTADYPAILGWVRGTDVVVLATAPTREHPEIYPEHSRSDVSQISYADCACAILDEARDHRHSRELVSAGY